MVGHKSLRELRSNGIIKISRGDVISKINIINNPGNYPIYSSSQNNDGLFGRYGKYMFNDESVTWSIDGGGKFFYRPNIKYSITNVCGRIKVANTGMLNAKYLYYSLLNQWKAGFWNYTNKAHPSNIEKHYYVNMLNINEQKAIADVLSSFDEHIERLSQLIHKKKAIRDGALDNLLSGKERLPGFTGEWENKKISRSVTREDGLQMVGHKSLRELRSNGIIKISRGDVISKINIINNPGNYPIYSSSQNNDGLFGRYGKYMFNDESVTWSIDGGGKFFYRPNIKYSITNVCGRIKVANTGMLNAKYLYYSLLNQWKAGFWNYTNKAHPSNIEKHYYVNMLNINEQKAIADVLTSMDDEIATLETERDKIITIKEGAMDDLLTGRVRLDY